VQRRLAYIKIVKPSGPAHLLKQPIVFTGASAAWTGGYTNILQKIYRRLCGHFRVESLHDPKVNEIAKRGALADAEAAQGHGVDGSLRRDAADAEAALLHAAVLARKDLDALLTQYAHGTADRKDRMLVKARIRYMTDEACLVGYRWGRAEADLRIKPLAEGGSRSRTAAPKGGRESGTSRRKKAEDTWQPTALKWAKEARVAEPTCSKDDILEFMREREAKSMRLPSDRRLMDFLREKEDAGEIPLSKKDTNAAEKKEVKGLHCLDPLEP
jgi:hypothetical protein